MKKLTTILFTFALFTLLFAGSANAQLSGPKYIPGDYATVTAAIAALNGAGVGAGGVTFNVAANYTETITATLSITATGTSGNRDYLPERPGNFRCKSINHSLYRRYRYSRHRCSGWYMEFDRL